jgi:sulfate transport system substrate-binding protein
VIGEDYPVWGKMAKHGKFMLWQFLLIVQLAFVGSIIGCGNDLNSSSDEADRLTLGAFSVTREVFHDGLIPAFQQHWMQKTGRRVEFEESYLASGALSRAINGGFDADVALFSLDPDVEALVKTGLVEKDWNVGQHAGHVVRSLVVIAFRPGNPKRIGDWRDLAKPDVSVVYADPKTSGGARWNLLAVASAGFWPEGLKADEKNANPAKAAELLTDVQKQVTVMDGSGRQSLATFLRQTGDAIVTYENDPVQYQRITGQPLPYVIPNRTIWIEMPAVEIAGVTQKNGRSALAKAFLEFLKSPEAVDIWGRFGFRPVEGSGEVKGLPPVPQDVVTVESFGGWKKAREDLFGNEGLWTKSFLKKPDANQEKKP